MANNRMWLRCTGCGGKFFLAKTMAAGWYTLDLTAEKLDAFFDEHITCRANNLAYDGDAFEVAYEHGPNGETAEEDWTLRRHIERKGQWDVMPRV